MTNGALTAAGGLGLFLLGMLVMTDGLRQMAGPALARVLTRFTRRPWIGAVTGALTTAAVQSSSATTVAAVGFVGAGLLSFPQALGVIFGANIGSTITGWMVALLGLELDLGEVAPLLVLAGVLLRLTGRPRLRSAGFALAGFGLVFVGIEVLREGMATFEGRVTPTDFPPDTWLGRLRLTLIGCAVVVVIQSSGAGVAATLTAVHAGALTLPQAAAMVVGMDVGTTVTAAISAVGGTTSARRTGAAHVLYNCMTGVCAWLSIPAAMAALRSLGLDDRPEVAVVAFHSAFNIAGVVLVLPFTGAFARLVERLFPERGAALGISLDRSLLREPALAVEAAADAARRMAGALLQTTERSLRASGRSAGPLERDASLATCTSFLAALHTGETDGRTHERHIALMHLADHLERLRHRTAPRLREGDGGDRRLNETRDRLARSIADASRRIARGDDDLGVEAARDRWRELQRFSEAYRRGVLRLAASSRVDDDVASGRLDEARRASRVAYHLWRILAAWRRIRDPRQVAAAGPPPPFGGPSDGPKDRDSPVRAGTPSAATPSPSDDRDPGPTRAP